MASKKSPAQLKNAPKKLTLEIKDDDGNVIGTALVDACQFSTGSHGYKGGNVRFQLGANTIMLSSCNLVYTNSKKW